MSSVPTRQEEPVQKAVTPGSPPHLPAQRPILVALLLFVGSLCYFLPLLISGYNPTDEGIILQGGARVASGQIVYRDFFEFFTPGMFYFLGVVFKLFGPHLLVARLANALVLSADTVLLYYTGRYLLPGRWSLAPALFFVVMGYPTYVILSHHWFSVSFAIAELLALCTALGDTSLLASTGQAIPEGTSAPGVSKPRMGKGSRLALGGALGAFSFLFLQNTGTYALVAGGLFLVMDWAVIQRLAYAHTKGKASLIEGSLGMLCRNLLWYAGGALGALLLSLGPLFLAVSPATFLADVFLFVIRQQPGFQQLPYPFPLLHVDPSLLVNIVLTMGYSLIFYGPLFVYPLIALLLFGRIQRGEWHLQTRLLALSWLFGLLVFLTGFPRPDDVRLSYPAPFLLLLVFWLVVQLQQHRGREQPGHKPWLSRPKRLLTDLILVLILVIFFFNLFVHVPLLEWKTLVGGRAALEIRGPRGTILAADRQSATEWQGVINFIDTHRQAGQTIFLYPEVPMFYFLTGRLNPAPHDFIIPGNYTPAQLQEVVTALERDKTPYIVYNLQIELGWHGLFSGARGVQFTDSVIDRYIRANYTRIGSSGSFEFWQRRS